MADKVRILGFSGSIRKGSYNKMALNAAVKLAPENAQIDVFDIEGIPLFNQDLEQNPPEREENSSRRSERPTQS
jgi:chromate reductase